MLIYFSACSIVKKKWVVSVANPAPRAANQLCANLLCFDCEY